MRKLIAVEFMSLDGVVQAPGDATEDPDGFAHGGWTRPYFADHGRYMPAVLQTAGGLVFGRKTYEIFAAYWPAVTGDDIASAVNSLPKYVASRTLRAPAWQPTTVLGGDVAAEVEALKRRSGKPLVLVGSSELAHTLIARRLVDEYQLWLHPILLGAGKRLFPAQATTAPMTLVNTQVTAAGVVILTYQPRHPTGASNDRAARQHGTGASTVSRNNRAGLTIITPDNQLDAAAAGAAGDPQ